MINRIRLLPTVVFSICLALPVSGRAERAPRSVKDLTQAASHIVTGEIVHLFGRTEQKGNFEFTYSVAEILVKDVHHGEQIEKGDRVYARYWNKRWTGLQFLMPPDSYGFNPDPEKGQTIKIYLRGDRKQGYDVLHPNGFNKVVENKDADRK